MNCLSCQKEIPTKLGYVSNSHRFCKFCFSHIIEKRVRKYLKDHPLKRGQRIVASHLASLYFAQHVMHIPLTILKRASKKSDTMILSETLDDCAVAYLEHLLSGKKFLKQKKNTLLLFSSVTDEELSLYCQYHKLPFAVKKHPLKPFLLRMETEHPGTIQALYKSMQDLKEIL
ncbi:hypothetical protein HZC31_00315 [Candidatus Woesearchaeota archaeon]|nr:hypothetical protein [Candidatus Woesearchaeota archaeon]